MQILQPSIVLFNFITHLSLNGNIYLESINHHLMPLQLRPGTYITNANYTAMPNTHFFFSTDKTPEYANGLLESFTYYAGQDHYLCVVHGIHLRNDDKPMIEVWMDETHLVSTDSNAYNLLEVGAGLHTVELWVHSKTAYTSPSLGGRFLAGWFYNKTQAPIGVEQGNYDKNHIMMPISLVDFDGQEVSYI